MDARTLPTPTGIPTGFHEKSLFDLLKSKSRETHEHSNRVGALAEEWIQHMHSRGHWLDLSVEELVLAATLHDLGKLGVSEAVLGKEGPLSASERTIMNQHSVLGFEWIRHSNGLEGVALAVLHHHERWDGGGYPSGLQGHAIPVLARIISIIDTFDAITSDRCYRKGRSSGEALEEIRLGSGTQFCPRLVQDFVQFLDARNT